MRELACTLSEKFADARWRLGEWFARAVRPRIDRLTEGLHDWASSRRGFSTRRHTMPELFESLGNSLATNTKAASESLHDIPWFADARAWWRHRTTKTRRRIVFFSALFIALFAYVVTRPTPIPSNGFTEEDRAMWARLIHDKTADLSGEPESLPYPTGLGPTLP
jgi:hypothetical protein